MIQANVSGFSLLKIRRPRTTDPTKLNTDPKTTMDLILGAASTERGLGSTGKYRILSFGEPAGRGEYRDIQGRLWLKAWWLIDFDDDIMLAYILPTPNGPIVFMTRRNSGDRHVYEWDMQATCDRIMAAYRGDLGEWKDFISVKKWVPESLEKLSYDWNEQNKTAALSLPDFSVKAGSGVFDWTGRSSLFISPSYFMQGDELEYGIRSISMQKDIKGSDYFVLFKNVRPDERLGEKVMSNWNDIVDGKYPFDGISRISAKDNTGSAGVLLNGKDISPDIRYSLYFNMENPGSEDALIGRLKILEEGISVKR
jgi:hypothetical protein